MKKILIVGRVNHNNYGDLLMVAFSAYHCIEKGYIPVVLEAHETTKTQLFELGINVEVATLNELETLNIYKCIFTGGGYFAHNAFNGNKWCRNWLEDDYFKVIKNYLKINLTPYYIFSVEVGPIKSLEMRAFVKELFSSSAGVYVRNKGSLEFCQKVLGLSNVNLGPDMVLSELNQFVENIESKANTSDADIDKVLLVHVTDKYTRSNKLKKYYLDSLISSINASKIHNVILLSDNEETVCLDSAFSFINKNIDNTKVIEIERYKSMLSTFQLLQKATHVITTKLHIGVSALALNKNVICFSDTPKSKRFYKSINKSQCANGFYITNPFTISSRLDKFLELDINDKSPISLCETQFYTSLSQELL